MSTFQKISFLFLCFFVSLYFYSVSAYDRSTDSLALIALYDSTDGPNWDTDTNWLDSGYSIDTWHGITVTNDRVSQILLNNNNLNGTLPPEIGNLTDLTHLYLNNNNLSGSLPSQLGNLTNLRYLYLNQNSLSGSIPSGFGSLIKLQYLYLHNNSLTGSIPVNLGYLDSLKQLYLYYNNLSGSIPDTLGSIANLENLYIYNNSFSGTLPSKLGNLSNLQNLYIQNNNFTNLGDSIVKLNDLNNLNIGNNEICQLSYNVEYWADSMDTDWYQSQDCDSTLDDDLVLYFPFDEGSGDTTYSTVNNFWLRPEDGYQDSLGWVQNGVIGSAICSVWAAQDFYEETSYFDSSFELTFSGWFKAPHINDDWIGEEYTCGPGFYFFCGANNGTRADFGGISTESPYTKYGRVQYLYLPFGSNTAKWVKSKGRITDLNWHHAVIRHSDYTVKIYIDGVLDTTATVSHKIRPRWVLDSAASNIQFWYSDPDTLDMIDEVYVFSRALSKTEIYSLYNEGSSRKNIVNKYITGPQQKKTSLPTTYILQNNFPNPFNKITSIKFAIPLRNGKNDEYPIKLQIFNSRGQLIKTLIDKKIYSGYYSIVWDGTDSKARPMKTGVYIYRLTSNNFIQSKKMFLTR